MSRTKAMNKYWPWKNSLEATMTTIFPTHPPTFPTQLTIFLIIDHLSPPRCAGAVKLAEMICKLGFLFLFFFSAVFFLVSWDDTSVGGDECDRVRCAYLGAGRPSSSVAKVTVKKLLAQVGDWMKAWKARRGVDKVVRSLVVWSFCL